MPYRIMAKRFRIHQLNSTTATLLRDEVEGASERAREREGETQRDRETETDRQTQTQTNRERQRERASE